jgi:hypothetical protein
MLDIHSYVEAPRVENYLQTLLKLGWRFMPIGGEHAGTYAHPASDVVDTLRMRDIHDCLAWRINGDPRSGGGIVWKYDGDLFSCIEKLLELPAPDEPGAPSLVIASVPNFSTLRLG